MRLQYTPIFRAIVTTRLWTQPHHVVRVWLWMSVVADPEGYLPADVAGVAIGANVSPQEARDALAFLEAPDPDADPEDASEGRLVRRVRGGFLVIAHEGSRELAQYENHKARNRKSMRAKRAAAKVAPSVPIANDVSSGSTPAQQGDVPKPKPIPKPKDPSEGISPQPPVEPIVRRLTLTSFPVDWQPSEALRQAALMAGVTASDFEARLKSLRTGPIGGSRGVFADELEAYVAGFFGDWRTWAETKRAKAANRPEAYPGRQPEPELPKLPHVPGFPKWVLESHKLAASMHELDLKTEAKAFAKNHHIPPSNLDRLTAAQAFTQYLLRRSAEAA